MELLEPILSVSSNVPSLGKPNRDVYASMISFVDHFQRRVNRGRSWNEVDVGTMDVGQRVMTVVVSRNQTAPLTYGDPVHTSLSPMLDVDANSPGFPQRYPRLLEDRADEHAHYFAVSIDSVETKSVQGLEHLLIDDYSALVGSCLGSAPRQIGYCLNSTKWPGATPGTLGHFAMRDRITWIEQDQAAWMEPALELARVGRLRAAFDIVFDRLDLALSNADFEQINAFVTQATKPEVDIDFTIGSLRFLSAAREQIASWQDVIKGLGDTLRLRGRDPKKVLRGL